MKKTDKISSPYSADVSMYSAFNKFNHIAAWISRFINNLKSDIKKKGLLSIEETEKAKKLLFEGQRWKDKKRH